MVPLPHIRFRLACAVRLRHQPHGDRRAAGLRLPEGFGDHEDDTGDGKSADAEQGDDAFMENPFALVEGGLLHVHSDHRM